MTTAKARFQGSGAWTQVPDFSDKLKARLRGFYPEPDADDDPIWGHPAEDFVNRILAAAWWAKSELDWQKYDCTKPELRAEQVNLLNLLREARGKLRSLSPDFDRLLGIEADPLGCADKIDALIGSVERAGSLIDTQPKAQKTVDKQHEVAVEMAVQVLRALKDYGITTAATAGTQLRMADITQAASVEQQESHYLSKAVEILKAIGDDIELERTETTWRDIICAAKRVASDLK